MDSSSALCFVLTFFPIVIGVLLFLHYLVFSWSHSDLPSHNPHHPGITVNTIRGKRDVICPKCKSPYCECVYEKIKVSNDSYYTRTKFHPFNVFKPFVEEKTVCKPGYTGTVTHFRCLNCGHIFD